MKTVSCIIPVLNGAAELRQLLPRLNEQSLPTEVIVIDSSSRDETESVCREFAAQYHRIPRREFDHGATRNLGASLSKTPYLLFLTQDALPADNQFVQVMKEALESAGCAAAYARQIPRESSSPLEKFSRGRNYPAESRVLDNSTEKQYGIHNYFFSNSASMIKREAFEELGGFLEKFIANEDMLFSLRAQRLGMKVLYAAGAEVIHSHDYNMKTLFRRYFDIGVFFRQIADHPALELPAPTSKGSSFVRSQLSALMKSRQWVYLPRCLVENFTKFLSYKCGYHHTSLPARLRVRCSQNRAFWTKRDN